VLVMKLTREWLSNERVVDSDKYRILGLLTIGVAPDIVAALFTEPQYQQL
jgi:hypothetical protein